MQRQLQLNRLVLTLVMFTSTGSLALAADPPGASSKLPLIVAHRGASYDAPENTLAAFNLAWKQGADGIEGDFFLSQDGHLVCIHDKDTKRFTGKKLIVNDTPLAVLQQLDVGSWKNKQFASERIPTIGEVFATIPAGKKIFIELKEGARIVAPLKHAIAKSGLQEDQLVIISFHADTIAESKRQLPHIRAHWLHSYKKDKKTGKYNNDFEQIVRTLKETKADGLGTKGLREVVTDHFLKSLRKAGLQEFSVWTINEPADAQYFQGLGTVAITTDRPGYLRKSLARPAP
ncbi:MAG: glycerophosphodiester phosphodiesterase [Planctomycetaceae bacterium]|nr:glycerophosphodiester phosphodiesterase [Planctomycetaceae bacterium]